MKRDQNIVINAYISLFVLCHFCAESGDVIEAESVCLSPVQLAGSSVQSGLWEEAGGG